METSVTLEQVLDLSRRLSLVDKVRLIEQVAPQIQRDIASHQTLPHKSLRGLWKGLDISEQDIAQTRREMWGNFPRGAFLMANYVTDTHGLIWYLEDDPRLGPAAKEVFDACDRGEGIIYVPVICLVEIVYLQEKNRIPADLKTRLDAELHTGASSLSIVDLTPGIVDALRLIPKQDVPEMPDCLIAATALYLDLALISRDRKLQSTRLKVIW